MQTIDLRKEYEESIKVKYKKHKKTLSEKDKEVIRQIVNTYNKQSKNKIDIGYIVTYNKFISKIASAIDCDRNIVEKYFNDEYLICENCNEIELFNKCKQSISLKKIDKIKRIDPDNGVILCRICVKKFKNKKME